MSDLDVTRRDLLRAIGSSMVLTAGGAGVLTPALAQHVHQAVSDSKSLSGGADYQPKGLTKHEFESLRKLSDFIVPADEHSKGALEAGAAEYIDFMCSRSPELAQIFTGGLAWLDIDSDRRYADTFVNAKPEQQKALLDVIAFRKNESQQTAPGIYFFAWARNMVVDAYYTSPVGMDDLGFMGNKAISSFSVPQEAVDYALKRSPQPAGLG